MLAQAAQAVATTPRWQVRLVRPARRRLQGIARFGAQRYGFDHPVERTTYLRNPLAYFASTRRVDRRTEAVNPEPSIHPAVGGTGTHLPDLSKLSRSGPKAATGVPSKTHIATRRCTSTHHAHVTTTTGHGSLKRESQAQNIAVRR